MIQLLLDTVASRRRGPQAALYLFYLCSSVVPRIGGPASTSAGYRRIKAAPGRAHLDGGAGWSRRLRFICVDLCPSVVPKLFATPIQLERDTVASRRPWARRTWMVEAGGAAALDLTMAPDWLVTMA